MRNPTMNQLQTRSTRTLLTAATTRMKARYICVGLLGILAGCGTASDFAFEEDIAGAASPFTSVSTSAQRSRDDSISQTGTTSLSHSGTATYYATVDDGGHCSFGKTGLILVGAMNYADYAGSAACGACVKVSVPGASVQVRITNECPECAPGDIDLSQQAFAKLASLARGRISINWNYVPCSDISGPIAYRFKDGSNPYWAALQIRNHVQPISSVAVDN